MSRLLRSKQGCWTCRLRKKKCDEESPRCSTCESLSIPCYGFGPKPDWMNNGDEERAVTNSIKDIVKHTSRRKAKPQVTTQHDSSMWIAPKSLNGLIKSSSSGPDASYEHALLNHEPSQEDAGEMLLNGSAPLPSLESEYSLMAGPISAEESVLLMQFLDNVFPLQYPGLRERGQGWLLALLLRTKPFYHVALALGAYYHRTTMPSAIGNPCRVAALVQQEKHLEICIKSVNHFAQGSCPANGLGIAISVVQLVFYELFTSHGSPWQPHLRAAINMYQQGSKENLARFGLAEKSRTVLLNQDPAFSEHEPAVTAEVANFRFLAGTILWLDINASITAGTAPSLLLHHHDVIAADSQIKLEDIMGCKNWVMLQVGRIAALYKQKTQALRQGHHDCKDLGQIAGDISENIQRGLAHVAPAGVSGSESGSVILLDTTPDSSLHVTHAFAYMASFYLHLVTHGFQMLDLLDNPISEAMRLLQTQISTHLLPALVAPLYVIGCVAKQGDEQFFRDIFSSPPLIDPILRHRERILPALEEIWTRKQATPGFTWEDSLELTQNILLI